MGLSKTRWFIGGGGILAVLMVEGFRHRVLEPWLPSPWGPVTATAILIVGAGLFSYLATSQISRVSERMINQQQKLDVIFRHSSDAIILTDDHGTIRAANPAAERLTGSSEDDLAGLHLWAEVCRTPEGQPLGPEACPVVTVARTGRGIPYLETTVATGNGGLLPVTASFSPVPDDRGKVTQVVAVLRDMSEKRALEAEVARLHLETGTRARQTEALYEISRGLASILDAEQNLEVPLVRLRDLLQADFVAYGAPDPTRKTVQCHELMGSLRPDQTTALKMEIGRDVLGFVVGTGHPLRSERFPDDLTEHPESYPLIVLEQLKAFLAVAVTVRGQAVGALLIGYRTPRSISDQDMRLLEGVSGQLGIAVENVRLFRQVEKVAMLEERDRLAREIHDGLAQSLVALHLKLQTLTLKIRSGGTADLMGDVQRLQADLAAVYEEVRLAILDLRPRCSTGADLAGYLREYLRDLGQAQDLQIHLELPSGGLPSLAPESEAHLIRIIQEALHNVIKHAGVRQVAVELEVRGDALVAVVKDEGSGFDTTTGKQVGHYGLGIMTERARMAGGSLEVRSRPGMGTTVVVRLPLIATARVSGGGVRNAE